ncbi:hypothetical protein DPMN_145773 [Dreissena polymorpha]|uniref:Uncharacterized protein n=1 Tax=Dreissena polymorpha TaxID=45954 RepID=A0A9D4F943_DREPO|nr:hypothetical protein DPMN_145773 [Dreissena polymorpha]
MGEWIMSEKPEAMIAVLLKDTIDKVLPLRLSKLCVLHAKGMSKAYAVSTYYYNGGMSRLI